jgi:hydroxymethylglutaryl-CoA lyase
MSRKNSLRIVEVGPRDGLQNEKKVLNAEFKVELVRRLADSGLKHIEIGAFVSPKWIPQMADSLGVTKSVLALQNAGEIAQDVRFSCLVPNKKGAEVALQSGIKEFALFGACSETFSKKNINCTIAESFLRFKDIIEVAKAHRRRVRGYLSTVFGCPYEGPVSEARVLKLVQALFKLGVDEVSLGDTIGVATPKPVERLLRKIQKRHGLGQIAMHFHDTRGTALANVAKSYELGVRVFDSSVGGLGGCPYAQGASGNLATEDLLYLARGMGLKTGVDLKQIIELRQWLEAEVGHTLPARVSQAGLPPKVEEILG